MARPALDTHISVADFQSFYWLKRELIAFCRKNGLPTGGSKTELTSRICVFLSTGKRPSPERPPQSKAKTAKMPNTFSRHTVIGSGWRCSQQLRAFFVQEIGPQFHFNETMRNFIKHGEGKALQEAIETWHQAQKQPKTEKEIAPQFEYNRHIREFFKEHPEKTLQDAIADWKIKKAKCK